MTPTQDRLVTGAATCTGGATGSVTGGGATAMTGAAGAGDATGCTGADIGTLRLRRCTGFTGDALACASWTGNLSLSSEALVAPTVVPGCGSI